MNDLKLNITGKIARFYCWNYGTLPLNFCEFFWKLSVAILLFPITWAGYPFKDCSIFMERVLAGLMGYFVLFVLAVIGYGVLTKPLVILAIFGTASVFLISFVIAILLKLGFDKYRYSRKKESETVGIIDIIRTKIKSVKENYCPRIEWTQGEANE